MKKRNIICLLLAVLMLLACTACGVEWLEMRSRMPGYSVWKARSFSER